MFIRQTALLMSVRWVLVERAELQLEIQTPGGGVKDESRSLHRTDRVTGKQVSTGEGNNGQYQSQGCWRRRGLLLRFFP